MSTDNDRRDTSRFGRGSYQANALCAFTVGGGLVLMPIALYGFGPLISIVSLACAVGGGFLIRQGRRWWILSNLEEGTSDGGEYFGPGGMYGAMPSQFISHGQLLPEIQRLIDLAESKWPEKLRLDFDKVEMETNKKGQPKLVSWQFRAVTPGFLASDAMQSSLQSTFMPSLGGKWRFTFDAATDTFGATQKSGIPSLAFPPNWPVVRDAEEAKTRYTKWEFMVGVTVDDVPVGFSPEVFPHMLAIGESGGGKSVAVRSWLEQFRAMGWMLILADGKGADYIGYQRAAGTIAIGAGGTTARGMSYIAAIVMAYQIMKDRQAASTKLKQKDPANWNRFTPVLLVLDEIKAMRLQWQGALSKDENKLVERMVAELTSLGRELRVHVLAVSQDALAESIPTSWKNNMALRVSIGPPSNMTIEKGFAAKVRGKVKRIGDSMDPKIKGRCLVAAVDDETGQADVVEYQGYLGYSPGESWDNAKIPGEAKIKWPVFKERVSDAVPHIYTRQWFKVDEPSKAQQDEAAKTGREIEYIDFDLFTVEELRELKRVALDMRLDGRIVPNPEMAQYDPASPQYVCALPAADIETVDEVI